MRAYLRKLPGGALIPDDDEAVEALQKIKAGKVVRAEIVQGRNPQFHRKYFALLKIAFDAWTETTPDLEYRGVRVQPNFDRFRRDVAILAGHFTPVFNVRGELRLEADSISFGSMDEETFEALYSKTIDVILQKILKDGQFTGAQLRDLVDSILDFA